MRRPRNEGIPLPRTTITSWGWVPAGTSSGTGPSIAGTLDRGAERRERRRDVDGGQQVVAVAHEPWVVADPDQHVQIARLPAALYRHGPDRLTADPLAVVDPGRNVDRHLDVLDPPGFAAVTARARRLGDLAVAPAHVAGPWHARPARTESG